MSAVIEDIIWGVRTCAPVTAKRIAELRSDVKAARKVDRYIVWAISFLLFSYATTYAVFTSRDAEGVGTSMIAWGILVVLGGLLLFAERKLTCWIEHRYQMYVAILDDAPASAKSEIAMLLGKKGAKSYLRKVYDQKRPLVVGELHALKKAYNISVVIASLDQMT